MTGAKIAGVVQLELPAFADARGELTELWRRHFVPGAPEFVQDNASVSRHGVLRGLHLQTGRPQGKLVAALTGRIFDVVVDARKTSSTFGSWQGFMLGGREHRGLWIPPGVAHGFCVTEGEAVVVYKCTANYDAGRQLVLAWNDPHLGIDWPLPANGQPIVSPRDAAGLSWSEFLRALD